ncbi:hypothetical protein [Streptomyces amakusaensis]|uniref:Uncharacterized protein n=1 Tax=Streptomyces amakusaensis TaxID=67271 RepID=A0ABW0AM93_9ACTN
MRDLLLAEDGADDVHVPNGVAGGDVRDPIALLRLALLGHRAGYRDIPLRGLSLAGAVEELLFLLGEAAVQPGNAAKSPGSKPIRSGVVPPHCFHWGLWLSYQVVVESDPGAAWAANAV